MYKRWKKVCNSNPSKLVTVGGELIKISHSDVQKAANNFSRLNIIGRDNTVMC